MTEYPKVSVVTITYGHENYITQTLDGVLMQDYPGEIEFIISNDNSPDQTDIIINNYFSVMKLPPNVTVKYTKHSDNKKAMSNLIWAIEQATGDYIAFCEGDDYWTDNKKILTQVDFLKENREYSACFTSRKVINADGQLILDEILPNMDWSLNHIYNRGVVFHFQTLVGKNDKRLLSFLKYFLDSYGADAKISFFFCTIGKVKSFANITSVYRHNGFGIWSQKSSEERITLNITESLKFYKKIIENSLDSEVTYDLLKVKLFRRILGQRIKDLYKDKKTFNFTMQLFYQYHPPLKSVILALLDVTKEGFIRSIIKNKK